MIDMYAWLSMYSDSYITGVENVFVCSSGTMTTFCKEISQDCE